MIICLVASYHKCRNCVAAKLLSSAAPITVKAFKPGVTAAQHLSCLLCMTCHIHLSTSNNSNNNSPHKLSFQNTMRAGDQKQ